MTCGKFLQAREKIRILPDSYRDTLLEAGAFDEANKTIDRNFGYRFKWCKSKISKK